MQNQIEIEARRSASPLALGEQGERLAVEYLVKHGYRIVATNFVLPIGYSRQGRPITGEIDIVAYDETAIPFTLAFVEVKTRTRIDIATPEAAVDRRKRRQIIRAARLYRRLMAVQDEAFRYDVISIVAAPEEAIKISLLRGYFDENQFARKNMNSLTKSAQN
ncbi:MAG: YraN family protein [Acidobacteria bacterium]|nr:YraN family protein [Acidobacteriota bacterium]